MILACFFFFGLERYWITIPTQDFLDLKDQRTNLVGEFLIQNQEIHDDLMLFSIPEDQLQAFSSFSHARNRRHGLFITHRNRIDGLKALRTPQPKVKKKADYTLDHQTLVEAFLSELKQDTIRETILKLSDFVNRYYAFESGREASLWIYDDWSNRAIGFEDAYVELFENHGFNQPSVILTLPGSTDSNESIVIGGHLDTKISNYNFEETREPGADDDASGIACMTEVIRALVTLNYRPETTVHFMAFAAEEIGLLGSGAIAQAFADRGEQVIGMMQLDMTNYDGSPYDITIVTDYTDPDQNAFLMNLMDTYLGLSYTTTLCGYGCSDHASWTLHGFPSSFPFETPMSDHNPFIHSPYDTLENCGDQTDKALKFSQLAAAYMVELAKGSQKGISGPIEEETRWIPHITRKNGGYQTRIIVQNPMLEPASVIFYGYEESGLRTEKSELALMPNSLQVFQLDDLFDDVEVSHFSIVGPSKVKVAEGISPDHQDGATAHIPESTVHKSPVTIFTGEWDRIFDGLALVNSNSEVETVTIELREQEESEPNSGNIQRLEYVLNPKAKLRLVLNDVFTQTNHDSTLTIQSDGDFALTLLRGTPPDHHPTFLYQTVPLP